MERRKFLRESAAAAVVGAVAGENLLADALGAASSAPGLAGQGVDAVRKAVHAHIDANLDRHIEKIQEYLRQPSISAEGTGIAECAEMTRRYLAEAGCQEAELIPSKGHPGVWGWLDAGARKTLVIYWMYDVQPVNESEWTTPPFEARLVAEPRWGAKGRIIRARGAINTKGPERAFLNAVESIRAVHGRLPVNLMFLCEGEEEMSSPHMPDFVERYKQRLLRANGVMFPMCSQGADGRATLFLGNKGIVYMELESHGGPQGGPTKAEIHSSLKAAVDSPVWRLVQALASFTDATGNKIRIAGLADKIRKPTAREEELVAALLKELDGPSQMKAYNIERWIDGVDYPTSVRRLLFDTTCNIDGMWAGYTGPGGKTILPHKANAKLDFRLVPNQEAADVAPLVRKHLDAHGFSDIKINWHNGYDPSQTDPDSALVKAAQATYADYGVKAIAWPRIAGSAPFHLFTRDLKLPLVIFGLGHGSGAHSVDEYLVIDADPPVKGLADVEKGYADFLFQFAQ
jgi:acetylornithine deacetylase/succinyl-diaminopimelate desuccinylase-like protein